MKVYSSVLKRLFYTCFRVWHVYCCEWIW